MKFKTFLRSFTPVVIVLLIFGGIILSVAVDGGAFSLIFKPARDYVDVLEYGLREGDHIKGDIYYSFGGFAEKISYTQYETHRGSEKKSGSYYMIPVGEYGIAAVYVRDNEEKLMDKLTEETYDYLFEEGDIETVLTFEGVAVKMDKELKGLEELFIETLHDMEYTDEEIEDLLKYTDGKCLVLVGPADVTTVYVMTAIGLILIAIAVLLFVIKFKKETSCEKSENSGEEKIEDGWTKI